MVIHVIDIWKVIVTLYADTAIKQHTHVRFTNCVWSSLLLSLLSESLFTASVHGLCWTRHHSFTSYRWILPHIFCLYNIIRIRFWSTTTLLCDVCDVKSEKRPYDIKSIIIFSSQKHWTYHKRMNRNTDSNYIFVTTNTIVIYFWRFIDMIISRHAMLTTSNCMVSKRVASYIFL